MSAAEKLEALDARTPILDEWPDHWSYYLNLDGREEDFIVALRSALPEIIAVVKAAQAEERYSSYDLDRPSGSWEDSWMNTESLDAALSALDEALPQIGSTSPPEGATSQKEENWRSGLWRNTR